MSFRFSIVEAYTASWIEMPNCTSSCGVTSVEAYTASWIEIYPGRLLRWRFLVEAYTASWIEIVNTSGTLKTSGSGLIQPRGLK